MPKTRTRKAYTITRFIIAAPMPKRSLIAALAAVAAVVLVVATTQTSLFRSRRPPSQYTQRLVVLGFDGLDPSVTAKWIREGKLPNLKRLADQGGMYPL